MAAAPLFPQNDGLLQKRSEGHLRLFQELEILRRHRRDEHHAVAIEGHAGERLVGAVHAGHAHVEQSAQQPGNHLAAVALLHHEVRLGVELAVLGQNLRQDIGRRDGGRPQLDDVPALLRPALQEVILELQDMDGALVELPALGRDFQVLGVPDEEAGVELLLQHADMGADRGLGEVGFLRRLGEAAVLHHRREGAKLLKVHGESPPAPPGLPPRPRMCSTSRRKSGWCRWGRCPGSCGRRGRSGAPPGS